MNLRIVLVRPRNPLNIGSVARAMANFGFDDFVVVSPYDPVWRETVSAVGAESLVLKAGCAKSLDEAVGDCQLVLGTTTGKGRSLERPVVKLHELGAFLKKRGVNDRQKIALLFGSEKTGLGNAHLEKCNAYVTIPTSSATPSMNLSHAVAVCCYELSKKESQTSVEKTLMATADDRERLIKHILQLFEAAEYLKLDSETLKITKIRNSLLQWNLRMSDVRLVHGILRYMTQRMKPGPR